MHYKTVRFAAALAAVMLAAGCEHTLLEDTIFDSEYVARHLPNEEKVLSATMFTPRPTAVVQTYCYTTIGEVERYARPQLRRRLPPQRLLRPRARINPNGNAACG
jgi:hypothetical protein